MKSASRRKAVAVGFMLFSTALLGLIGYSFAQDFIRSRQVTAEVAGLEHQVKALETRKLELSKLMQYFDSEGYAESRARLELGLAKPGEHVLVVPPQVAATPASNGQPKNTAEAARSPLRSWWAYFFQHSN